MDKISDYEDKSCFQRNRKIITAIQRPGIDQGKAHKEQRGDEAWGWGRMESQCLGLLSQLPTPASPREEWKAFRCLILSHQDMVPLLKGLGTEAELHLSNDVIIPPQWLCLPPLLPLVCWLLMTINRNKRKINANGLSLLYKLNLCNTG